MRRFMSVVFVAILSLTSVVGASAQSTEAQVEVTGGGVRVVSITAADLGTVAYDFDDTTASGNIVVHVEDNTGSADGWNVTIFGDEEFASSTTTSIIPIENLAMGTGTPVVVSGQPVTGITAPGVASMGSASEGQSIASAPVENGQGIYDITYPSTLTVPGGTQVGVYEATLTVTITAAP